MKVLQISNYYPPDIGGIENIAASISSAIKGIHKERVICFSHGKKSTKEKVGSTVLYRCGTNARIFSQQLSLSFIKCLKRIMANYSPDVIIIHVPNPFTEFLTLLINLILTKFL